MVERVALHRKRRSPSEWETVESPLELPGTLQNLKGRNAAVLVDCITMWLTNMLLEESGPDPESAVAELCNVIRTVDYPLVLVTNEVGWGIVPDNALARRFRDLSGFAGQRIGRACRTVTLVAAGLPLRLK